MGENYCDLGHYEEGANGGRCLDERLGNADWAYQDGVRCEECGHTEVLSMAREGCECCQDVLMRSSSA